MPSCQMKRSSTTLLRRLPHCERIPEGAPNVTIDVPPGAKRFKVLLSVTSREAFLYIDHSARGVGDPFALAVRISLHCSVRALARRVGTSSTLKLNPTATYGFK